MRERILLLLSLAGSLSGIVFAMTGVPVIVFAYSKGLSPEIDPDFGSVVLGLYFFGVPAVTLWLLRRSPAVRKTRLGSAVRITAIVSLLSLLLVTSTLTIRALLPGPSMYEEDIQFNIREDEPPNQPVEPTAASGRSSP